MPKYYDIQKISCFICKHLWILGSNRVITDEENLEWIKEVLMEHEFVHQKWEKEHE